MSTKYQMFEQLWNPESKFQRELTRKELANYFYSLALDWLFCNFAPEDMKKAIEDEINGATETFTYLQ